jgi:hypothetical protein
MIPRRLLVAASSAVLVGTLFAVPSFATTATTTPPTHTKLVCEPSTKNKTSAPAINATATYQAGGAGSVIIKRTDATTLTVSSTKAGAGWTATVTAATGHRVKVTFADTTTRELQHFGIGLSARGTFVMVSTSHCHH